MDDLLPFYLFVSSAIAALVLFAVQVYIRKQLGKDHDKGYLFFAWAFVVWAVIHAWEIAGSQAFVDQEAVYFEVVRHLLSVLNSALLLYSISYLKDGLLAILQRVHDHPRWIGLGLGLLSVGSLLVSVRIFFAFDALSSILVLAVVFVSINRVFHRRGLKDMALLAILTGGLVVGYQLVEFFFFDAENLPAYAGWMRIGSRFLLIICLLVLALSWLGKQLGTRLVEQIERKPNYLRFVREKEWRTIHLRMNNDQLKMNQGVKIDLSAHHALFEEFNKVADSQKGNPMNYFFSGKANFKHWPQSRGQFLELLQKAMEAQAEELRLDRQVLDQENVFECIERGKYRFRVEGLDIHLA